MTMTEEEANRIFNKFKRQLKKTGDFSPVVLKGQAKMCAIISVQEIIKSNPYYFRKGRRVMNYKDHSTKDLWRDILKRIEEI